MIGKRMDNYFIYMKTFEYKSNLSKEIKFEAFYQGRHIGLTDYRLINYIKRNWVEFKNWSINKNN